MTQQNAPIIRIEGLSKVFGSGDSAVTALKDVSINIAKGEIHGIIGMSGAGKSTLIRLMNRLETPTTGSIYINGENIMDLSGRSLRATRKRMSMIFQHFNLLMQRNVLRNVRYPMEISNLSFKNLSAAFKGFKDKETPFRKRLLSLTEALGITHVAQNARALELLGIVGLQDKAKAYPSTLSGGQKQRVAIARALASNPDVLLSDEATSALDPMTTQAILSLIQDINRRMGITVVIITHEMAVIRQVCTRVTIIDDGKIVEEGTVDDVFTHTCSAAGRRLFGIVDTEIVEEEKKPDGDRIRIVFDGASARTPVVSALARECGINVNILHADMNRIGNKTYGQMLIETPENENDKLKLTSYLEEQQGVSWTEV